MGSDLGHGRPLGATLIKMIGEHALHSGEAYMSRFAALGEIVARSEIVAESVEAPGGLHQESAVRL